ncbi:MAG: 30S ribosomal protein S12 methylthiotransferase RimO [Rhodobacteraceae bacterium]|jgi:ribosomal protein S12 methylthiotransferase|nr:MAG: 30S ribosomal protein S12 methylthiotransferase RimO [Paracoccaceae bacterium]|tara:strand:+ start:2979 stop:4361 length:1383 start_codon:yes stop_codon:yes gene_type:complete
MSSNPSLSRPDQAKVSFKSERSSKQPNIGMVSLGCPKALVDSERILTRLRAEGYGISPAYKGADAVIVNTCGFLDSAKAESLEAIGEAIDENGRVIVTGCLGADPEFITGAHPRVLAVTGPHQYENVLDAVHQIVPPKPDPFIDLLPETGIKLTPRHFSYLKISEGCNHKCKFCIIPQMRGRLQSRPAHAIIREATKLVENGVKELLVISQDTSAFGLDLKYSNENGHRSHIKDLASDLGQLGAWVRLHYVYPYPHVRELIPLMADGLILPYLDIPFQHAHPAVLKRMARPAASVKTLDEIKKWRSICPEITLRSTFIVGYPGETEDEFNTLIDWLDEAQIDRVGCFKYEDVEGARSNSLSNQIPEDVKQHRWEVFMEKAGEISAKKLAKKIGEEVDVIVDEIDEEGAICRTKADAPEIDGNLFIESNFAKINVGDILKVNVTSAGDYDLWGTISKNQKP